MIFLTNTDILSDISFEILPDVSNNNIYNEVGFNNENIHDIEK